MHPPGATTRFSSLLLIHPGLGRRSLRAFASFRDHIGAATAPDPRETPPQTTEARQQIVAPRGTLFDFDETLRDEFIERGTISSGNPSDVIGRLKIKGKEYEFSVSDFRMATENLDGSVRDRLPEDRVEASFHMVMWMYGMRNPHEVEITWRTPEE